MPTYRSLLLTAVVLTSGLVLPRAGFAQCSVLASRHPVASGPIGLVPDATLGREVVEEAIDLWEACENYGVGFPAFRQGTEGTTRQIAVKYQKVRRNPGPRKRCGWFSGNTITLFGYILTEKGPRRCGSLAHNLAHELGHVLGLVDAPDALPCATDIMSDLTPENLFGRFVRQEECRLLGSRWLVSVDLAEQGSRRPQSPRADPPSIDDLRRSSRGSSAGAAELEH